MRDLTARLLDQRLLVRDVFGRLQQADLLSRQLLRRPHTLQVSPASARFTGGTWRFANRPGNEDKTIVKGNVYDAKTAVAEYPWDAHHATAVVVNDRQGDDTSSRSQASAENGGIDFNYVSFDIKTDSKSNTPKMRYAGAEYKGIILKSVTTQSLSTTLSAWASALIIKITVYPLQPRYTLIS